MRLLVFGGTGGLGGELTRQAGPAAVAVGSRDADLRDPAAVRDLVRRVRPDAIVNAAYRQDDWVVTADGAAHVAAAARSCGVRLVHVSSDAVFSGVAGRYDETCPPAPATVYGAAKAAAETAVRAVDAGAVIARTSLIVGGPRTVIAARVHAGGVFFTDDVRCPVDVGDLATALLELAASPYAGVHHVAGADAVSRYELARLIAARDGLDPASVVAGSRAAAGLSGAGDVRLDCAFTQARLTVTLRGARDFLTAGPAGPG
ncbi:sugar nucleotide-binding protein [Actinoplanes sp. CA-252034]|uniref:sugar nucleotide-binding protein n=1 Tax=Actinoplanes sp. CA-252034 TaxID=3239906 RepID=UPI003D98BF88